MQNSALKNLPAELSSPVIKKLNTGKQVTESGIKQDFEITFYWQQNSQKEEKGKDKEITTVVLEILGVTDHHAAQLCQLQPVVDKFGAHTGIWSKSIKLNLPRNWQGSYFYIPVCKKMADVLTLTANNNSRQRWLSLLPYRQVDKLNNKRFTCGEYAVKQSIISLNNQELASYLQPITKQKAQLKKRLWHSDILANSRQISLLSTQVTSAKTTQQNEIKPLIILLDGEVWTEQIPLADNLQAATEQAYLPAADYLFIPNISGQTRTKELTCNPRFWQAISQELLSDFTAQPIVLVGQSLAGLASLYASLNWPQCFRYVVSQSASLWWPLKNFRQTHNQQQGLLSQFLALQRQTPNPSFQHLHWLLQYGSQEHSIAAHHLPFVAHAAKQHIQFMQTIYPGGHDKFCWYQQIFAGLHTLFQSSDWCQTQSN